MNRNRSSRVTPDRDTIENLARSRDRFNLKLHTSNSQLHSLTEVLALDRLPCFIPKFTPLSADGGVPAIIEFAVPCGAVSSSFSLSSH